MLQIQAESGHTSHKAAISHQLAAVRAQLAAKAREKRIVCTTCGGKTCVGRCRFKKFTS